MCSSTASPQRRKGAENDAEKGFRRKGVSCVPEVRAQRRQRHWWGFAGQLSRNAGSFRRERLLKEAFFAFPEIRAQKAERHWWGLAARLLRPIGRFPRGNREVGIQRGPASTVRRAHFSIAPPETSDILRRASPRSPINVSAPSASEPEEGKKHPCFRSLSLRDSQRLCASAVNRPYTFATISSSA